MQIALDLMNLGQTEATLPSPQSLALSLKTFAYPKDGDDDAMEWTGIIYILIFVEFSQLSLA